MKKALISILILLLLSGCAYSNNSSTETSNKPNTLTSTTIKDITSLQKEICEEAVSRFSVSVDTPFESGERICVDNIMLYYTLFNMRTEHGELLPELEPYRTGQGDYEIKIPKTIVNNYLKSVFMVELDDSNSFYYQGDNKSNYILDAEVRGEFYSKCLSFSVENDVIVVEYESGYFDLVDENDDGLVIEGRYSLGISILNDKDIKYMFCRKLS